MLDIVVPPETCGAGDERRDEVEAEEAGVAEDLHGRRGHPVDTDAVQEHVHDRGVREAGCDERPALCNREVN